MNSWQRMVREFHFRFGQTVNDKPTPITPDQSYFRAKLMKEELCETVEAMALGDMTEVADGLADLIYVALGTAVEYGIDLDPVFKEVHRTNLLKMPNPNGGKILKPDGWEPPRIAEILESQSQPDEWPRGG